ncbi:MAG: hypothetical protein KTR16_12700 [Acidiferrobacterales bacterium]|nr:hypothetical protein [Acidiferrobacterales bacterium]
MTITNEDIYKARREAERQIQMADEAVRISLRLAVGRLKVSNVSSSVLAELKKELSNFNAKTGEWRE